MKNIPVGNFELATGSNDVLVAPGGCTEEVGRANDVTTIVPVAPGGSSEEDGGADDDTPIVLLASLVVLVDVVGLIYGLDAVSLAAQPSTVDVKPGV
jgi:hypothetical protein